MKIPDLIGKKIDEAKEILSKKKIKYFDETKTKLTVKETSGKVVKVEEKDGKLVIYESKNILLILIMVLAVLVLGFGLTYGNGIFNSIKDNILETNIITKPKITEGSKEWVKEALISIEEDSKSKKKIDYYEYCVIDEDDSEKCEWKRTDTKNVRITHTGHHYVFIRAVDEEGRRGKEASTEVFIDNNGPIVADLKVVNRTKNSIRVALYAKDDESGVNKYLYSLDGVNYVEGEEGYTFTNLEEGKEYRVYAKVIDKLGNEKIVSVLVRTLTEEEAINQVENPDVITDENGNVTVPDSNESGNNNESGNEQGQEDIWDIPQIDLIDLPTAFEYSSEYELPSNYDFGNDTGSVLCQANGKEVSNTKELLPGKYLIVCTATSSHNKSVTVDKRIEVTPSTGSDELLDGWIRLNLYYPENSTNWEWRLDGENGIRTGYDGEGWTPYTGPILVKVEDVENIYIRYELNGETYIIAPKGKLVVDIEPNYYEVALGKVTKVKITYDKNAKTKEYRVNGGSWQEYTGPFEVGPATKIEARVTKDENVYDNHGDLQYVQTKTSYDSVYIRLYESSSNPGDPPGDTPTGGPWVWCEHFDCSPWCGTHNCTPTDEPTTPTGGTNEPSYVLAGPVISSNPNTGLVESTMVTITPQETARTIYYSIGYGSFKQYTGPFSIDTNSTIYAYYIRQSDGKKSSTSYYYVENIKQPNLPYLKISANPSSYLTEDVNSVTVSISGSDYDGNIEYSLDGVMYQTYTGPLTITQSSTVYARATNQYGTTTESKTIRTKTPSVPKENLDIVISTNPSASNVQGLIGSTQVSITYDSKATKKYYKIGYNSSWQEYTGPFTVTENATVYAYCTSSNGVGEAELGIGFLTTGIASPKITVEPASEPTQAVKVEITYANNAEVKRYKIGNGSWIDYTGPIYIYENTTIYAMNRDVLNHEATSSKAIKNITVGPTVIDKGAYYIIKLNYPDVAEAESRQYKWKIDGTWKTYDPQGILLIKEGFTLPDLGGGYQVEDENGNTVIFRDHYYQLDCPLSEVSENLYMRWDSGKPAAPTIMVDPSNTSTREVTVVINYPQEAARRLYKTVTVDGVDSGWMEYTSSFKIDKKGTMIYAKSVNRLELESKLVTKTITNIDEEAPELTLIGKWTSLDDPKQKVSVTVKATDDVALDVIKYAKGNQSVDYFNNNGTLVNNNTTVMLDENGEWTFYAVDKVGNAIIEVITVENIDTTAPQIVITDITEEFGSTARISIDYGDSDLKQYKICSTGTYTNYTGIIEINGTDYSSCQNSDGSLTVYAKGKDQAGNETEVTEDIYTIDLDKPAAPIISASAGYPILTEYGVKYDDALTVVYDNRSDIINYIDLGNGEGWKVYTGSEHVASGTVKAKSVKKTTGLESDVVTKSVTRPSNALGSAAYDGDKSTAASGDGTIIKVDSSMIGKYLDITIAGHGNKNPYYSTTQFRRVDGTVIKEENFNTSWDPATTQFYIPEETDSLVFTRYYSNVYEIRPYDDALIHETKMYPKLTESGVDQGYNTVTIDYFNTSIVRQYKIVPSGENEEDYAWLNHPDTDLRLELGETIYARGIDKNATPTVVRNYTSVLPSDALQPAGYDGNASTSASGNGTRIDVDSAMIGKKLSIRISGDGNKSPYYSTTQFKKADGTVIKSENYNSSTTPSTTQFYIPEETAYLSFIRYYSYVYEIGPDITPVVLLDSKHYPMIDVDKVEFGYNLVNLAYLSTLPTKLYKIGDDEWQDFNQNPIKVEAGKTLSVKAISSNGTESTVVNYISVLPDDTLSANAYDDNLNTVATIAANSTYTVDLSSNLVDYRFKVSLSAMPTSNGYVKIYDENNNEITSSTISDVSTYIDIPSGATRMKISAGSSALSVKEISITDGMNTASHKGNSILSIIKDNDFTDGNFVFGINGSEGIEIYPVHMYTFDGDQVWDELKQFGTEDDIGNANSLAQKTVIVKVNGNLTIGENGIVEPFHTDYGGPKGFMLYVTGSLINNGNIRNNNGAYAEGQNVYLWKNHDGSYETVPAYGSNGGDAVTASSSNSHINGNIGLAGVERSTAGGGSGAAARGDESGWAKSGAGARGTSYSGGTGGGGVNGNNYSLAITADTGSQLGGQGGNAKTYRPSSWAGRTASGGAGNPGGMGSVNNSLSETGRGPSGTGGLLVVYADNFTNNATIQANGTTGGNNTVAGGSSGGGSVNIFYNTSSTNNGTIEALGGAAAGRAGAGGDGTVTIGSVNTGSYKDRQTVYGESIFSILSEENLPAGYWTFRTNGQKYNVHLYVLEGDQIIDTDTQYGDVDDVGTATTYAKNMVIVKVKGNYTVNSGVTVEPFSNEYGGPKGFVLYVTGTLTNNGTINNNHGAYAAGQNVYMYKNADGTYEYIPASGGIGGDGYRPNGYNVGHSGNPGGNGIDINKRALGGGGSGGTFSAENRSTGTVYRGGNATSYSGGTGSGSLNFNYSGSPSAGPASDFGGAGGYGASAKESSGWASRSGAGGAGNPGGRGSWTTGAGYYSKNNDSYNGSNGTGGLLIIFANKVDNEGSITATGSNGGYAPNGNSTSGGSSGGGSINIFFNSENINNGTLDVSGGVSDSTVQGPGGNGGDGTVTYTQISTLLGSAPSNLDDLIGSASVGEITRQTIMQAPRIKLNNTDISESKIVSIKYLEGKIGEYSLDLGNTWIEYTGEIEITENTIILARTKDENGNIISSSSMSITKIKKVEIPVEDENPTLEDPTPQDIDTSQVEVPETVEPVKPDEVKEDNNTSEEGDTNE